MRESMFPNRSVNSSSAFIVEVVGGVGRGELRPIGRGR
jgi:hypothetical protein